MSKSAKQSLMAILSGCAMWLVGGIAADYNVIGFCGGAAVLFTGAILIGIGTIIYLNESNQGNYF